MTIPDTKKRAFRTSATSRVYLVPMLCVGTIQYTSRNAEHCDQIV